MDETNVICECEDCGGRKLVCQKTRKRHMRAMGHGRNSRSRPLHQWTTMTTDMLCVRLLQIYTTFAGVSQACMSSFIEVIRDSFGTLSTNEHLPKDFNELQQTMAPYLPVEELWTTCPGECDIFEGTQHGCKAAECSIGRGKQYHYIPLITRLRQMYSVPSTAKQLQDHVNRAAAIGEIADIHDSPAWTDLYGSEGIFHGDPRSIALEFSADGFSPFHHSTSSPYSIEQQTSVILNLPRNQRTKPGFMLLHGFVPGPSAPKEESYNLFLRPLVNELQLLKDGVSAYDSHNQEQFTLRATVLLQVHDFPGQAKVFHGQGSGGFDACFICRVKGINAKCLHKTIYRSGREFLEADDVMRKDTNFPGGGEVGTVPQMRDFTSAMTATAMHGVLLEMNKTAPPRSAQRKIIKKGLQITSASGARKRSSEFDRLGPLEASKVVVEGMHTIQGVAKNLHGLINGHTDNNGVREHERSLGRFPGCYPNDRGRLPAAPFTMTTVEKKTADGRLKSIQIPPGQGILPKEAFMHLTGVKSHTWHLILTRGIYPFLVRGLLGERQRKAVVQLCHILSIVTWRVVYEDLMDRVGIAFHRCLCIMDREFPETLKTILWHMLRHIPQFLVRYGPIRQYWMFAFERSIHIHASRLHNKKSPEAAMIKAHRIEVVCALVSANQEPVETHNTPNPVHNQRKRQGRRWDIETNVSGVVYRGEATKTPSIVYIRNQDGVFFGRIMYFFAFNESTYVSVRWFKKPRVDADSQLLVCDPSSSESSLSPVVDFSDLPEPLMVAREDNQLFILNFIDKRRVVDILQWLEVQN